MKANMLDTESCQFGYQLTNYIGPCSVSLLKSILNQEQHNFLIPERNYVSTTDNLSIEPVEFKDFSPPQQQFLADISGLLDSVWLLKTKVFSRVETPALSDDLEHLLLLL